MSSSSRSGTVTLEAALYNTPMVIMYRGDFMLREYQYAINFSFGQVTQTAAPSYLFGERSTTGWWYFFPVSFLLKTSAGLHLLLAVAALFFAQRIAVGILR